jgi:sugar phosphate isomerase/epimerase
MITPHRDPRLTRRQAIGLMIAAGAAATVGQATEERVRSRLGLVIYDCALRRKWFQQREPKRNLFEPLTFLRHCREVGASGMQAALGVLDGEQVKSLRAYAEEHSLVIDGIVHPPKDQQDLARFEAEIRTASEVRVQAVRTVVIPGRRYEQFQSLKDFREAAAKAEAMLKLARPVVEKHRVRLAVENHKDQRLDERIALLKEVKSDFIGVCVDTGNNVALLDDPYETVEALAPFAFTVHLKDQAVRETDDGFLLGDIPLGQGCFDLARMVNALQKARPEVRFMLELITRDALRVPCLTEPYWITMPAVPGRELARTLRLARTRAAKELQSVSTLSLEKQVALEDANIATSLRYACEHLKL